MTLDDAQHYAAWLSKMTGKTYRLPSEAEYEYATRAGTTTAYPWGDDTGQNNANCSGCGSKWANQKPAPVGSFTPNHFGLYDMVGNVWEWTEDCVHTNYNGAPTGGAAWMVGGTCEGHIIRGGSWLNSPDFLRSGNRNKNSTVGLDYTLGFRVVRVLNP